MAISASPPYAWARKKASRELFLAVKSNADSPAYIASVVRLPPFRFGESQGRGNGKNSAPLLELFQCKRRATGPAKHQFRVGTRPTAHEPLPSNGRTPGARGIS
jgi:hypothetical protein